MNLGTPDPLRAIANYRQLALTYDASCRHVESIRIETVALLGLRRGDHVLDVASGTGMSFPALRSGVGNEGAVVGIELSPDMCARARERVQVAGWTNVQVVEADALTAQLHQCRFDAVLFHYTHDVMRQPATLHRLLSFAKPGARIAVAGFKAAPGWAVPLTWFSMWRARKYLTTFEGLRAPWSHLVQWVPDFEWQPRLGGSGYVGWGHTRTAELPAPLNREA